MPTYDTLTDAQMEAKLTAGDEYGIDGHTVRSAILTIRDRAPATSGLTASVDELNILDGALLDVNELNILNGVTATAAEINAAADVSSRLITIADATPYAVLVANSGKPHAIAEQTSSITINLPTAANGLEYEFFMKGFATEAQNWVFDTGAAAAFYLGGLSFLDLDAGAGADEVHAGVYPDGNSNDVMTIVTPAAGTRIRLYCDGTNWVVNGTVVSATIPTFAD